MRPIGSTSPGAALDLAQFSTGLRAAFRFRPGRPALRLDAADLDQMDTEPGEWTWVHVDLVDPGTARLLPRLGLDQAAIAALTGAEGAAWIETAPEGLRGHLPDFEARPEPDETHIGTIRFAASAALLVTARTHPLHAAGTVLHAIDEGLTLDGPEAALEAMMLNFAQLAQALAREFRAVFDGIEDALLADRPVDRARLQRKRRRLLRLARQIQPLHRALGHHRTRWPQAQAQIEGLHGELESLADRARLLAEDLMGRIAEDTNRRLYVISMITALLVPPTLVTGFFGMNTGGLPFAEAPWGTWAAAGLAALACAVATLLLQRRR